jgi:Uma2 family endonuclease
MAILTPPAATGVVPYRLTVQQFSRMIDANVFDEDRVELLGGILYPMTINLPHAFVVTRLSELLRPLLPVEWSLWEEKPVPLDRYWRPQPDLSVLKSPSNAFARRWPRPSDIASLVEVSDTTYSRDAGIKLPRYAHVRIPLYWIVHLEQRRVEVYSDPYGRLGKAGYRRVEFYPEDVVLPVVLDGRDLGRIAVKDLLP